MCLRREIHEELGIDVQVGRKVLETSHEYPERIVELHFFECILAGDPVAKLGQELRWANKDDLGRLQFPPADAELIRLLQGWADST